MKDELILKNIRAELRHTLPSNSQAYLFGSRARGDNRPDSDWDILIVLDKPMLEDSDYSTISYPLTLKGLDWGAEINPIMYTAQKWRENAITPFYHNVMDEGKRL